MSAHQLKRLLAAVGLALAFVATSAPDAEAQQTTRKAAGTKKKKKKGGKKKKPAKPGATPVEMGDLDEPEPAPATATPAAAPAGQAAPATSASNGAKDKEKEDADEGDDDEKEKEDHPAKGGDDHKVRPITAALLMGVGVNATACGTATCNAYGFGLGLRGGYTLPSKVYVGGTFVYHLGYTSQVAVGSFTRGFTGGVGYFGPEVGYDLTAGPILVRPYGGLGIGLYRQTDTGFGATAQPVDSGGGRFAFWPGVTGMYPMSPSFFLGADARFVLVANGASGFSFFATGGMRL